MEREFYRVERGGESFKKIEGFIADWNAANKARYELMKRYGGSALFGSDSALVGFVFEGDDIPDGWMVTKKSNAPNVYVPNRLTKQGRAAAKELSNPQLRLPGGMQFHWLFADDMWLGASVAGKGFPIHYILYEKFGDDFVLTVPTQGRPKDWEVPTDCKLMKRSEYWLMKEAKEAAKSAELTPKDVSY